MTISDTAGRAAGYPPEDVASSIRCQTSDPGPEDLDIYKCKYTPVLQCQSRQLTAERVPR